MRPMVEWWLEWRAADGRLMVLIHEAPRPCLIEKKRPDATNRGRAPGR